jgi:hypothetical protein
VVLGYLSYDSPLTTHHSLSAADPAICVSFSGAIAVSQAAAARFRYPTNGCGSSGFGQPKSENSQRGGLLLRRARDLLFCFLAVHSALCDTAIQRYKERPFGAVGNGLCAVPSGGTEPRLALPGTPRRAFPTGASVSGSAWVETSPKLPPRRKLRKLYRPSPWRERPGGCSERLATRARVPGRTFQMGTPNQRPHAACIR